MLGVFKCCSVSRRQLWGARDQLQEKASVCLPKGLRTYILWLHLAQFGLPCLSPFLATYSSGCPPAVSIWELMIPNLQL